MIVKFLNTAPFLSAPEPPPAAPPPAAPPPPVEPPPAAPPPAAPAAPVSAPPWGADVNQTWMVGDKPWYEHLPDGPTKTLFQEKKYANPVVLADSYYSANRMINGNAVEVPAADAPPEAWKTLKQKLGALEAPDKYEIKMPDGLEANPDMLSFGKELAFELGLRPQEAQVMADKWNKLAEKMNTATLEQTKAENAAEMAEVKTRWGDKFDALTAAGRRVVSAVFATKNADGTPNPKDQALLGKIEGAIGASAMMELFARIGSKSGEGGFSGGEGGGDPLDGLTPQQAEAEINRLQSGADKAFYDAFTNAKDPGHAAAVARMEKLYAKKVGAKPTP